MSDGFASDVSLVRWHCLEVAKHTHTGKSTSEVIAAAKEYEKYVLPRAVKLKLHTASKNVGKK